MSRQWIEVHAGKEHSACICVCVCVYYHYYYLSQRERTCDKSINGMIYMT